MGFKSFWTWRMVMSRPRRRPRRNLETVLRRAPATSSNEFPPMLIDHALRVTCFDLSIITEDCLMDGRVLQA